MRQTEFLASTTAVVDRIIKETGNELIVATPLGLGKPLNLINALYARAKADTNIQLTFLTALSLEIPRENNPVRKRLLQPVFDRLYAGCDEPHYARDISNNTLPVNVTVKEFYFRAGSRLGTAIAQRNYISSNYTHAARDAFANGCNVLLQMLAPGPGTGSSQKFSMSCNPDTMSEMMTLLDNADRHYISVGVAHDELPYMYGDAEVSASRYDIVLQPEQPEPKLFPVPRLVPVGDTDHMIGLQASALIPDGGTLQIGIGAMGDAIAHSLSLRQSDNGSYLELLRQTGTLPRFNKVIADAGDTGVFSSGVYGATEMLTEGFLQLLNAGILKRRVYDFWALQQLINAGNCNPDALSPTVLDGMEELGVRELRGKDFDILQHHGFFDARTQYHNGYITTPAGTRVNANIGDPQTRRALGAEALGTSLQNGHVLHGGFFVGSSAFYEALRNLDEATRRSIGMCGVDRINQLDLNPRLFKAQRLNARFINTGLKVSINGAVVSDTLEDGRVLSGVGGQYNFVAMAHHLQTGRSVLMIRAVREHSGGVESNVVTNYGSCTIPRHLRDIVVTEYGIADLRSKTDSEVAAALIEIADSRFQQQLLKDALAAGKISADYVIPEDARNNLPATVTQRLARAKHSQLLPPYPGGCDFSDEELALAKLLRSAANIQSSGPLAILKAVLKADTQTPAALAALTQLGLNGDLNLKDKILRRLIAYALADNSR